MLIHAAQVSEISVFFNTYKLTNGVLSNLYFYLPQRCSIPVITPNAGVIIRQKNVKISAEKIDRIILFLGRL